MVMNGGGLAPHDDERWAAQQVVRQHVNGRCKQCTGTTCPMLAWAQAALGDGPVAYPRVEPAQPLLTA